MNTTLSQAERYIDQGRHVFLLKPDSKEPLRGSHGYKDATTDIAIIRDGLKKNPAANLAMATGRISDVFVIDVDNKNGHDGEQSLKALQVNTKTRESATPSGGRHLYYKYPSDVDLGNTAGKLGNGLDTRGNGGYSVAPPSSIKGINYDWLNQRKLAQVPDEIIELLQAPAIIPAAKIPKGTRNNTLFREACLLRAKNTPEDEALAMVRGLNKTECSPPLSDNEVRQIVASAWSYPPGYQRNDLGNAQRLLAAHGEDIRLIIEKNTFAIFGGTRWEEDHGAHHVTRLLKESNRTIWDEVQKASDLEMQKKLAAFAAASQNTKNLKAAIENAKSEPGVAVPATVFDANPMLLGVMNGVVDLLTGYFRDARREDFITKAAGCAFDKNAKCPTLKKFLKRVLADDNELIRYIQRAVGYSLTGQTVEQVLFFVFGPAQSGKSVFLEIVKDMLGDYAKNLRTEILMTKARGSGGPTEDEARLIAARFVTVNETSNGQWFNEAQIKDLTGGDSITAAKKYENSIEFRPNFKIWVRGNHKPQFSGDDSGMARRIKLVPFAVRIPDNERDNDLTAKLRAELPGILNWAIEGCIDWQRHGLGEPDAVKVATRDYLSEQDLFGEFLEDRCDLKANTFAFSTAIYSSYRTWCEDNGAGVLSMKRFTQKLEEHGVKRVRRSKGAREFKGITLREVKHGRF